MSSLQLPLFEGDEIPAEFHIARIGSVKYTKTIQQELTVESFEGWERCNMVAFGPYHSGASDLYWVTDINENTISESTLTFSLEFCAPSSLLRKGDSVTGVFSRTPSNLAPHLKNSVTASIFKPSRSLPIGNMGVYDYEPEEPRPPVGKMFWLEMVHHTDSKLHKWGAFVMSNAFGQLSYNIGIKVEVIGGSNVYFEYPKLGSIINDPEDTWGVQADVIDSISISERCPYEWEWADYYCQGYKVPILSTDFLTEVPISYHEGEDPSYRWGYYDLTDFELEDGRILYPEETEMEIELSEMERAVGSVSIMNESGTVVATVPTEYGPTITLTARTFSDYAGIYTTIKHGDVCLITLNEGRLPWVGDAWKQYCAYNMQYDRAAVFAANEQARAQTEIDLTTLAANLHIQQVEVMSNMFSMTDPLALASGYLNSGRRLWALEEQFRTTSRKTLDSLNLQNEMSLYMQRMKEEQMKQAPGTAYSMGYGTIYLLYTYAHGACVRVDLPANLTETDYNAIVHRMGYPCEGVKTVILQEGFIQGIIDKDGSSSVEDSGYLLDLANRTIKNGLYFKEL